MMRAGLNLRYVAACLLAVAALLGSGLAAAERIKDIASIAGVRSNQLVGYGLVVGLDGTGDNAPFTDQSVRSMLSSMGVNIPHDVNPQSDNTAAVMVTAELPAFSREGQQIDVKVSSLGNADSLQGGELLMTPLRGSDGEVYAVAQGGVIVGGFGAEDTEIPVENHLGGSIPRGAMVERSIESGFGDSDEVVLNLHNPDFTTARRTAEVINENLGPNTARAVDAGSVRVRAPADADQRVSYVSFLEELEVEPGEAPAQIIVNSRTGTIVMGSGVRVRPAAVSHGNMTVAIAGAPAEQVAEDPLGLDEPVMAPEEDLGDVEGDNPAFVFQPGADINEIVDAINSVGAAPGDLIAILEALKRAGALRAELTVL
ncbi:flagellar basal body P-ring protein FlgI [Halorhodospira halochloris]|uniref:flagellar basal body P-ring protein FlgI n=1 Tax=Halorhodospira halochloris TaxID=1052 RepID=UPI001EE8D62F|nr:flagellar basal body P-ring protein FlgI [Halorhodospira halochloris]MCG5530011.1 flagellar basal body P-ring protein FlgI [Halorhodospira halochloris]